MALLESLGFGIPLSISAYARVSEGGISNLVGVADAVKE